MVIQETKNIFTAGRAKGDSFIGRKSIIDYFCTDWKQHSETGNNHAIHGLNRMGKSSIAEETLRRIKEMSPDAVCVYEKLGSGTWPMLIRDICFKIIHAGYFGDECVKDICSSIISLPLNNATEEHDVMVQFELLMEYTFENSQKLLVIIDEMDAAKVHWKDKGAYFDSLREIADKCSRFLILISRRPLKLIEEDSRGNSTFHGVFKELHIGSFDREDMEDYYLRLNQLYGISLDEEEKKDLEYFSGCCPFFLSRIGDRLAAAAIEGREIPSVMQICSEKSYRENCIQQYEDILERMREDGLWEDVVKVLMGITVITDPAGGAAGAGLTKDQVTLLENRGYLRYNLYDQTDEPVIYSSDFTAWARKKTVDCTLTETYKYIIESEVAIREMLREEMPEVWKRRGFSNDWNEDFLSNKYYVPDELRHVTKPKYDNFGNTVPSQLQRYLKTARIWNEDAEVVDALTIYDKLTLVKVFWNLGISRRFNNTDYSEWEECFAAILDIRNPLFHANITVSNSDKFYKLAEANEFCIRIIKQLNS